MKQTAYVTVLMFAGLVALGIWQAAFQEGLSWAAWLDSWSFSLLSMLLIIGLLISSTALLYSVIRRLWNAEPRVEVRINGEAEKKNQKMA